MTYKAAAGAGSYRPIRKSHSSAAEPGGIDARAELHKMAVGIRCPSCDWKQIVPLDDWLFQSQYGHGYTCGSGKCPSHTHLIQDDSDDRDAAIAQAEREKVLGLARDMYSLMMCVEKTNTDEFMEYYTDRMKGLKEQYESLRGGATQQGGERR